MSWSVLDGKACQRRKRDSSENEESNSEQQVLMRGALWPQSDVRICEVFSSFSVSSFRFAVHKSSSDDGCGGEFGICGPL